MKIRCTCTVFARNGKLHHPHCQKRQAYERQKQHPTPPSERKAGKRTRIKEMMGTIRPDQPTVVDEELAMFLGMKESKK